MLTNPEYQSSVSQLSDLIMDQPLHPLDRAVWWLEYLLRHPHNTSMRPHAHDLYWLQYFLLDILAVVIIISSILIFILYKLISCCRRGNVLKKKSD